MISPPITGPRQGTANWQGLWSLYRREVKRFLKVYVQTLTAPIVTSLLFLAVFSLAFEGRGRAPADIPFIVFLVPGLIMMALLNNAFANTSSSLGIAKYMGHYVDSLMPPLRPTELVAGYVLAGMTRGVLVAIVVGVVIRLFVPIPVHQVAYILLHAIGAATLLSLLGLIIAIWAEQFDQMAAMTNFVITPLTFLSGTFYSIQHLPEPVQLLSQFNPFFYMIDGFRYGFLGHAEGSLLIGGLVVAGANIALWWLCSWLIATGYRLKS